MFNFKVYIEGKHPKKFLVRGAYVFGHDDVPLPAEINYANGILKCVKRSPGLGGLVLLWPVDGVGQIILRTTRLEERQEPYNLNLELARSRLMHLLQKREDWGLFDFGGTGELAQVTTEATNLFLEALSTDDQVKASELADKSLAKSVDVADKWAKFCSKVLLERRIQAGAMHSTWMACGINPACLNEKYRQRLREGFGHLYLPVNWRDIEPIERQFNWQRTDEWINWLTKQRLPVRCGPLISLSARNLPDWVYLWENDFEGIRDLMYEHVQRMVSRYGDRVAAWDVVSGINAENPFKFSFEQLIELTRVAALATKRLAPRCNAIIELVQPWGEYRAKNMQTVPAAMFADMSVQSGVNFDALGVKLHFGIGRDGYFVRDFFQISSLLDEFASLGKPLHITGVEVPSSVKADPGDAWGGSMTAKTGGYWRRPWDDKLQAEWLKTFVNLAISKPFVESICWSDLSDAHTHNLPHSGLLKEDYSPKPAHTVLMKLAEEYNGQRGQTVH
ncbi:MAG: hypothetical protein GWP14_04485 [Actinobacteria bacterium]|nr:hypothetical protein [Actinomycetota bacterium]